MQTASATSAERVRKFHQRQREQGRQLVTLYVSKDTKHVIRGLSDAVRNQGGVIDDAVDFYIKNSSAAQQKLADWCAVNRPQQESKP